MARDQSGRRLADEAIGRASTSTLDAGKPADRLMRGVDALPPRLLDVKAAARYLGGLSIWTVRALVADGHIRPVELPSVRRPGERSRRLLFDRVDLDAAVDRWRG